MDRQKSIVLLASSAIFATCCFLMKRNKRQTRNRSIWVKPWIARQNENRDVLSLVHDELRIEDPQAFQNFLRMSPEIFDNLLEIVKDGIEKQDTIMRESISARKRLAITLRFLATGESYISLMYATRIHHSTISLIVPSTCKIIYAKLKGSYLKFPETSSDWLAISHEFETRWDYPMCIGAIDGKHIAFRPPRTSGSLYWNYKGFNSIVLLGVVNAEKKFIYCDVGVNGRVSDGGVFNHSSLARLIGTKQLNLPSCKPLPGRRLPIPYHFIGDDAFAMQNNLIKPYPHRELEASKQHFNYRLSRARAVVEDAFGILANRFRVLLTTINLEPDKVDVIILACVSLHNFLAEKNGNRYFDLNSVHGKIASLQKVSQEAKGNISNSAKNIREELRRYFMNNPKHN